MDRFVAIINAFIEDTCVLIVIAYLLARGRLLALLLSGHVTGQDTLYAGFILGLVGMSEIVFPGARAPYVTHTLIVTFATLAGGIRVGLVSASVVTVGAALLQTRASVLPTALALFGSALVSEGVRRLMPRRVGLVRAFIAGAGGQAGAVALSQVAVVGLHHFAFTRPALASMAANGFGVLILRVVLREAGLRADSERHRQESERDRLEVERARTLVAEAQLVALRARVHPHFLFNTLTSIAALCGFAPAQAETAIVRLSQVMRRALDANPAAPVCLADEIEFARGYVEIEQYRLGSRLEVVWDIDAAGAGMQVPAFSLQTLVENAILHGIAPQIGPGTVRIVIRCYRRHTFVAVQDNGIGMTTQECLAALAPAIGQEHGLQIVAAQLRLLYGARGRLRLFSRQTKGTIAAFAVPNAPEPEGIVKIAHEDIDRADRG